MQPATRLVHAGTPSAAPATPPLTLPIYETSTFIFESAADVIKYQEGALDGYLYSRYENPTVAAVEQKLAALDQAEASLLFGSGMAAISTTLMALLRAGDEVLCSAAIYGGTFHLLADVLSKFGVSCRFLSLAELAAVEQAFGPRTRLVWFESPINPTLRCVDARRVASACRQAGVLSVMDNTFASPINQPVLPLGVDVSMQSATKYLNGHSDVTAGVISGPRALLEKISKMRRLAGGVIDPMPAYVLGRSLTTLPLRIARQNASALALAAALEPHPAVARVYYPGLPSHPDHAIAAAQMQGFGGMVTIDLAGGRDAAFSAFDRLKVIKRAVSLGGVESICSLPVLSSQYGLTDEELDQAGVTKGMMRISVGLEDPGDLIEDVTQALA